MNKLSIFCGLLLLSGLCLLPDFLWAQNNLVLTSPAAANPGGGNVLVGINAGNTSMTNQYNTVTGYYAGNSLSSGKSNSFYGTSAGRATTTGTNNAFFGVNAGFNNTASENTFVGYNAGFANTSGTYNIFLGVTAGYNNTTGLGNTLIGYQAGMANSTAAANTFLGYQAGLNTTTGGLNTFIGHVAGLHNTIGIQNTFVGFQAGNFNTTGTDNTYLGKDAGIENMTGSENVLIGFSAGSHSAGSSNTFIGSEAGLNNGLGSQNTFVGMGSGTANGNPGLKNATAIGYNANVTASNSLILGNGVNVGIGNTAPANKLEITQGTSGNSGLRLTNLTSSSPATVLNQHKFLTVNASGDVILGSTNSSSARLEADLWSASGEYVHNTTEGGVIIGQGVEKTPAGYSLFVGQGLLAEKVKVAVRNTSEWSDYVFKPGYQLQSLTQVEQYISKHGHLPGVPSAQEMVERGNDLHQTDTKLLEKIEELTLYNIQLEKANQQKNEELQAVKQQQQQQQQELQMVKQKQAELERLLHQLLKRN